MGIEFVYGCKLIRGISITIHFNCGVIEEILPKLYEGMVYNLLFDQLINRRSVIVKCIYKCC